MRYGCMMASKPPVLVVEDEMFIRMIAVDTLEDRGYGILEAGDAREALAVLEQTPGIALIFTDVNMPGDIDGLDLATEVAKRWPHIEIIVTSGALRLDDVDIPDSGMFLPKPYLPSDLIRLVKEQLARHNRE
jgi:CheY-like chemotaxis protein